MEQTPNFTCDDLQILVSFFLCVCGEQGEGDERGKTGGLNSSQGDLGIRKLLLGRWELKTNFYEWF